METILGIQIIAVLFALFMLYVVFLHFKRENINKLEFLFWTSLWCAFIYFSLFPKVLNPLLDKLFVTRAMDLLTIIAFMVLAYLGFANHIGVRDLQRRLETLIRKQAIKNVKKNQR